MSDAYWREKFESAVHAAIHHHLMARIVARDMRPGMTNGEIAEVAKNAYKRLTDEGGAVVWKYSGRASGERPTRHSKCTTCGAEYRDGRWLTLTPCAATLGKKSLLLPHPCNWIDVRDDFPDFDRSG